MLSAALYAAGYSTGLAAFWAMARRRRMATEGTLRIMAVGLIGGLVAGNIAQWVFTFSPGKSILGAVAGGYLAVILYKRQIRITRPTGDLFAVALCAGEAVGRWGCYFGGCCYGKPTSGLLAVWQHNEWRHPTQLYLSASCLLILACLLRYNRIRPPENSLLYLHGFLYSGARFGIEFLREGPRLVAGLTTAQLACTLGFVFFGYKLLRNAATAKSVIPANAGIQELSILTPIEVDESAS
jgi:phosphatidylglycerol:prolipoprotein diacylglycerol transferase